MNKDTAIKLLNMYLELNPHRHDLRTAIETVLKELDVQYQKGYQNAFVGNMRDTATTYQQGYQDGFKQAEFEFRMNGLI